MKRTPHIAHATWTETSPSTPHRVEGTCERCGRVVAAIELGLRTLGFGRGEQWWCEPCRLAPKVTKDDDLAFKVAFAAALAALAAQAKEDK